MGLNLLESVPEAGHHRLDGLALICVTLLDVVEIVDPLEFFRKVSVLLDGPSTFLALAVVGFMKLMPPFCAAGRRVLGSVLAPRMVRLVRVEPSAVVDVVVEVVVPGVPTPVRVDPLRDMVLVTELRDALELERLRFSFELVARA